MFLFDKRKHDFIPRREHPLVETVHKDRIIYSSAMDKKIFFFFFFIQKFSWSGHSIVMLLVCIGRSTFEISRHHTINQVKSTFNCIKKAKLWSVTKSGTARICAGLICVHTCITVNGQPKNPPKNCL